MAGRERDNLEEIREVIGQDERSQELSKDLTRSQEILQEYPAPEPDSVLLAKIRAEVAGRCVVRTVSTGGWLWRIGLAAAAVILLAVGFMLFERDGSQPRHLVTASLVPVSIWESDDIAGDDPDLVSYVVEIEQIEDQIKSLRSGENGGNGSETLEELEIEFMEFNSEFWKG